MKTAQTSRAYRMVSASFALAVCGGWAFYVNEEAGQARQIVSAATQGFASFAITLIMVKSITYFYNRLPDAWYRMLLPSVITVTCTGSALVLAHHLAGTPHIAGTVIPPLSMAFLFSLYTTTNVRSNDQNR